MGAKKYDFQLAQTLENISLRPKSNYFVGLVLLHILQKTIKGPYCLSLVTLTLRNFSLSLFLVDLLKFFFCFLKNIWNLFFEVKKYSKNFGK
jgi:hypothetical protein